MQYIIKYVYEMTHPFIVYQYIAK